MVLFDTSSYNVELEWIWRTWKYDQVVPFKIIKAAIVVHKLHKATSFPVDWNLTIYSTIPKIINLKLVNNLVAFGSRNLTRDLKFSQISLIIQIIYKLFEFVNHKLLLHLKHILINGELQVQILFRQSKKSERSN